MMIILEGPDGAGKTTLAEAIMKHLGDEGRYIHATKPKVQFPYATDLILQGLKNSKKGLVTVFDRLWVSDNIYGVPFPSEGRSYMHVRRQDSVLQRFGAFHVLCTPHPDSLAEAYAKLADERFEMWGHKVKEMREIACLYQDLFYGNLMRPTDTENYVEQQCALYPWKKRMNVTTYDRFGEGLALQRKAREIVSQARHWHSIYADFDPLSPHDELSGSLFTCKALLVGEQVAKPGAPKPHWPFYAANQSAGYLTQALQRAKVCETHVALTNALSASGSTSHLRRILSTLSRLRGNKVRVIALGGTASRQLRELGVSHVPLPHPQYARRFDHHGHYHHMLEHAIYGTVRRADDLPQHPQEGDVGQGVQPKRAARAGGGRLSRHTAASR